MTDITTCSNQIDCRPRKNQPVQTLSNFVSGIILKFKVSHEQRRQHRIDREAFRNLMSLDEANLKDIGVSRDDIIWASKLAMHENASKELEKIRTHNIATTYFKTTQDAIGKNID